MWKKKRAHSRLKKIACAHFTCSQFDMRLIVIHGFVYLSNLIIGPPITFRLLINNIFQVLPSLLVFFRCNNFSSLFIQVCTPSCKCPIISKLHFLLKLPTSRSKTKPGLLYLVVFLHGSFISGFLFVKWGQNQNYCGNWNICRVSSMTVLNT